jgi:hypothetical protein
MVNWCTGKSRVDLTKMRLHTIEKEIGILWSELIKRYGEDPGGVTRAQIDRTVTEMKIDSGSLPYLYATFLSEGEFQSIRQQFPGIQWSEVEQTAQIAFSSLQHTRPPSSGSFRGPIRHI